MYKVIINKCTCHSEIYMKVIDSVCESKEKAVCTNLGYFFFSIYDYMFMLHLKNIFSCFMNKKYT